MHVNGAVRLLTGQVERVTTQTIRARLEMKECVCENALLNAQAVQYPKPAALASLPRSSGRAAAPKLPLPLRAAEGFALARGGLLWHVSVKTMRVEFL